MAGGTAQVRIDDQFPHSHLGQDSSSINHCHRLAFPVYPARKQECFRRGFGLHHQKGGLQHTVSLGSNRKRIVSEHKTSLSSRTVEGPSTRAGRRGGRGNQPGDNHTLGNDGEIRITKGGYTYLRGQTHMVV